METALILVNITVSSQLNLPTHLFASSHCKHLTFRYLQSSYFQAPPFCKSNLTPTCRTFSSCSQCFSSEALVEKWKWNCNIMELYSCWSSLKYTLFLSSPCQNILSSSFCILPKFDADCKFNCQQELLSVFLHLSNIQEWFFMGCRFLFFMLIFSILMSNYHLKILLFLNTLCTLQLTCQQSTHFIIVSVHNLFNTFSIFSTST